MHVPSTNLFIDQTSGYLKNKGKLWGYIYVRLNTKGKTNRKKTSRKLPYVVLCFLRIYSVFICYKKKSVELASIQISN